MTTPPTPHDWHPQLMRDRRCIVCGWREGQDNGVELHTRHQAHILGDITRHDLERPFDAGRHAASMASASRAPAPTGLPAGTVHIWLIQDPETFRVSVLLREPTDGDFPRGLRGIGWPVRQTDVPAALLARVLRADIGSEEMDQTHRSWWSQSAPEGVGPWPA